MPGDGYRPICTSPKSKGQRIIRIDTMTVAAESPASPVPIFAPSVEITNQTYAPMSWPE